MLMIALLDVQGIDAYPILLKTINEGFTDPNKATMDFNHMIVYADLGDKNTYWIDPTVPFCKLGKLPWQDEGWGTALAWMRDEKSR